MLDGFAALCARLAQIDLFGKAGKPMPKGASLSAAVKRASPLLPHVYGEAYTARLEASLPRLHRMAGRKPAAVEVLTGAVYQHGNAAAPLERFLAVISDLYRSFLDRDKRAGAGVPLAESLPPLALFQHDGASGPFTVAVDDVGNLIGGKVGVVSMPATYAAHPILWAALAHETGGHDVLHADAGLLDELGSGMRAALADVPRHPAMSRDDLARLWAYWIDEASADVYGLLNCGPAFVPNLAALLGALNARTMKGKPVLRMESRFAERDPDQMLDAHPTDILRLHIGIGAIERMTGLSRATRSAYLREIEKLANRFGSGTEITLEGNIPVGGTRGRRLQVKVPLKFMQQAARNVGGYIAAARLKALKGHSIQEIETWDDADEAAAQAVRAALLAKQRIDALGDDAQLLAGATLALLEAPQRYDAVTSALNDGLDRSFDTDPIWGTPPADAAYLRYAKNARLR
jgi:hypothetical protein